MFNFFKKKKQVAKNVVIEPIQEEYNDIKPIAQYFHNETGITFDKQMSILKNKVTSFCKQRKIYSFEKLFEDIKSNQTLKQELIDYLTTNETYFYREFTQIKELVQLVKKQDKSISILCAPSSTGEEPYSIAIALLEAGVSPNHIRIVGIDINQDALTKSKAAIYSERNIRNLSSTILNNYFIEQDARYILKENVKSLVTFKLANIFDNLFTDLGKFDFIFSRNMLIYFDKQTKQKAKTILEDMRKNTEHDVFFGHADLF